MNARERSQRERAIWRSTSGCECPSTLFGKPTPKHMVCTTNVVRCNGRLARIHRELALLEIEAGEAPSTAR